MNVQQNIADRIFELEEFARLEGFTLPFSAAEIVALEDRGFVIDLRTGQILEDIDIDAPIEFEIRQGVKHERQ